MKHNDSDLYAEARRRVEEKAKFYKQFYFFIAFSSFFLFLALRSKRFFLLVPVLFWGIAILAKYLKVFGLPGSGILSRDWEEQEIQKEMDRLKGVKEEKQPEEKMELKELRKNYDESELV